jgi:hypothetical protein
LEPAPVSGNHFQLASIAARADNARAMADELPVAARDGRFLDEVAATKSRYGDVVAEPSLFRFRTRHLLLLIAAASLLLAGLVTLDGVPAIAFLLAALVIAFHVFGNALGSKLRLQADRAGFSIKTDENENLRRTRDGACGSIPPEPTCHCMPQPWFGRIDDAVPWIPRLTAVAVFCGGCLGAVFLTLTVGGRTSAAGLAVGAVSFAAISGWLAFLGGNLYANVRRGLREALDDPRQDGAAAK